MSKLTMSRITFFSVVALCLTGCQEAPNSSIEEQQVEKQEEKAYENLLFTEDFTVEQPDLQTLETFEMTINPDLSVQGCTICLTKRLSGIIPMYSVMRIRNCYIMSAVSIRTARICQERNMMMTATR